MSDLDRSDRARMDRVLAATPPDLGGENAQPSVGDMAAADYGYPESAFRPDPKPQRMGSGDHFNPQQFADQLGVAHVRRSAPLVHGPDKTTWFAEGDRDDS